MGDEDAEWFQVCAYCGSQLAIGVSHPVYVDRGKDGDLQIYSFCNEECKENWLAGREGSGER